ncbi:F-box/FBD/LRR-repeat protein At1g13570-like [Lycium ferocissimum]|uniref:F-box/FBD/LRR-repeat protein At1g13570-like n=1 Tax=Lycium ferocissimum TaxID=112874 RepID=UPI002814AA7B|nr:F-box/FBD/LRR-repeat protein At1g13570-like [Lycium ferocissimum]
MDSNGEKRDCQSVPLDVLGSLPESVIDDILICLPLRDAVRTSMLSRKWRYKWCRISQLKLDDTLWETTKDMISPTVKFTNIIYHLLTFHAGPISKFILSILDLRDCPEIDKLVYFLSRNGIQHLDLRFFMYKQYKVPSSIFTCLQLRHLSLESCSIQLAPPDFKGFDRLISLKLCRVVISSKILESLISNCPLLEQLLLHNNAYIGVIEINAPMLRSFDCIESTGLICLKSVSHLAKLTLRLRHRKYHVGTGNFFESVSALEYLQLNAFGLKFLVAVAGEVPTRLPFDVNCVKHLCLVGINLDQLDVISCFLCLIRSFLYLQYFEIQVLDKDDDIPALECLELEAFSDVTFNHLREVKLTRTIGSDPEMQLIKILLAKSPVLERMLIEPLIAGEHAGKTTKIPVVLNSFRRASPEVQVVYRYYGD